MCSQTTPPQDGAPTPTYPSNTAFCCTPTAASHNAAENESGSHTPQQQQASASRFGVPDDRYRAAESAWRGMSPAERGRATTVDWRWLVSKLTARAPRRAAATRQRRQRGAPAAEGEREGAAPGGGEKAQNREGEGEGAGGEGEGEGEGAEGKRPPGDGGDEEMEEQQRRREAGESDRLAALVRTLVPAKVSNKAATGSRSGNGKEGCCVLPVLGKVAAFKDDIISVLPMHLTPCFIHHLFQALVKEYHQEEEKNFVCETCRCRRKLEIEVFRVFIKKIFSFQDNSRKEKESAIAMQSLLEEESSRTNRKPKVIKEKSAAADKKTNSTQSTTRSKPKPSKPTPTMKALPKTDTLTHRTITGSQPISMSLLASDDINLAPKILPSTGSWEFVKKKKSKKPPTPVEQIPVACQGHHTYHLRNPVEHNHIPHIHCQNPRPTSSQCSLASAPTFIWGSRCTVPPNNETCSTCAQTSSNTIPSEPLPPSQTEQTTEKVPEPQASPQHPEPINKVRILEAITALNQIPVFDGKDITPEDNEWLKSALQPLLPKLSEYLSTGSSSSSLFHRQVHLENTQHFPGSCFWLPDLFANEHSCWLQCVNDGESCCCSPPSKTNP